MVVKIFSILVIPFTFFLGKIVFQLVMNIDFDINSQLYFCVGYVLSFLISMFFISTNNFFSVYNHEFCHMFWSLLSLKKPKQFTVSSSGSGGYSFYGKSNMMITLSPYFFPLYLLLMIPIVEFTNMPTLFFAIFGIVAGWVLSVQIKQAMPRQTDLKKYGIVPSYLIIIFFQLLFISLTLAYLQNRIDGMANVFTNLWGYMIYLWTIVSQQF